MSGAAMSYALSHSTKRRLSAGKFYPLGATLTHEGVNFALYSAHAHEVFLLLFDRADGEPTDIIRMENRDRNVWHCLVHGVKGGQLYGYKVRGPFDPWNGLRFNENKLLIDPYAKALSHEVINTDNLLLAYDINSPEKDVTYDARDNTRIVPKCVVIDDTFDWKSDAAPDIPFERLVVYETHLKGFTAHASSKAKHAGTYLGFMEKIPYLKELGVNAVELLPVHSYVVEDFLRERKLTNYWGYNTVAFFAPHLTYGSRSHPGAEVQEFKTLVRELHRNGIEVILDVVYNHTAEGNEMGPTLSLKGIDNPTYYCLSGGAIT
jgi:isoamylase